MVKRHRFLRCVSSTCCNRSFIGVLLTNTLQKIMSGFVVTDLDKELLIKKKNSLFPWSDILFPTSLAIAFRSRKAIPYAKPTWCKSFYLLFIIFYCNLPCCSSYMKLALGQVVVVTEKE